jgi:hypothetical protein
MHAGWELLSPDIAPAGKRDMNGILVAAEAELRTVESTLAFGHKE